MSILSKDQKSTLSALKKSISPKTLNSTLEKLTECSKSGKPLLIGTFALHTVTYLSQAPFDLNRACHEAYARCSHIAMEYVYVHRKDVGIKSWDAERAHLNIVGKLLDFGLFQECRIELRALHASLSAGFDVRVCDENSVVSRGLDSLLLSGVDASAAELDELSLVCTYLVHLLRLSSISSFSFVELHSLLDGYAEWFQALVTADSEKGSKLITSVLKIIHRMAVKSQDPKHVFNLAKRCIEDYSRESEAIALILAWIPMHFAKLHESHGAMILLEYVKFMELAPIRCSRYNISLFEILFKMLRKSSNTQYEKRVRILIDSHSLKPLFKTLLLFACHILYGDSRFTTDIEFPMKLDSDALKLIDIVVSCIGLRLDGTKGVLKWLANVDNALSRVFPQLEGQTKCQRLQIQCALILARMSCTNLDYSASLKYLDSACLVAISEQNYRQVVSVAMLLCLQSEDAEIAVKYAHISCKALSLARKKGFTELEPLYSQNLDYLTKFADQKDVFAAFEVFFADIPEQFVEQSLGIFTKLCCIESEDSLALILFKGDIARETFGLAELECRFKSASITNGNRAFDIIFWIVKSGRLSVRCLKHIILWLPHFDSKQSRTLYDMLQISPETNYRFASSMVSGDNDFDLEAIVADYEKSDLREDSVPFLNIIVDLCESTRQYELMLATYERLLKSSSNNDLFKAKYAFALIKLGFPKMALSVVGRKASSPNATCQIVNALALCLTGDSAGSEAAFLAIKCPAEVSPYLAALRCYVHAHLSKFWGVVGAAINEIMCGIRLLHPVLATAPSSSPEISDSFHTMSISNRGVSYDIEKLDIALLYMELHRVVIALLEARGSARDCLFMIEQAEIIAKQYGAIEYQCTLKRQRSIVEQRMKAVAPTGTVSTKQMLDLFFLPGFPHRIPSAKLEKTEGLFSKILDGSPLDVDLRECKFSEMVESRYIGFSESNSQDIIELMCDNGYFEQRDKKRKFVAKTQFSARFQKNLKQIRHALIELFDETIASTRPSLSTSIAAMLLSVEFLNNKSKLAKMVYYMENARSLTLKREILEVLLKKLNCTGVSQSLWPVFNYQPAILEDTTIMHHFHRQIFDFYSDESLDNAETYFHKITSILPTEWRVISLSIHPAIKRLFLLDLSASHQHLFKLSESEFRAFEDGMAQMRDIIKRNDEITHSGSQCITNKEKAAWWKRRKSLDSELGKLIADIGASLFQCLEPIEDNCGNIVLVLDNHTHFFPWESMPYFEGHSITRIPSLSFLRDRLHLSNFAESYGYAASNQSGVLNMVDKPSLEFVLNPSGDLVNTENEIGHLLSDYRGISGNTPSSSQWKDMLEKNDIFLYFGHSGGEQYIKGRTIRSLNRCASVLLFGCSSGRLKDTGEYDSWGTPVDYMIAGAPCVLGNLWDVTDRDIDRVAIETLTNFGLNSNRRYSLPMALSMSRKECKLRYLTGAAPVIYGIPVRL